MNSSALPSTIIHPDAFNRSPSAGYDGVTDWAWFQNGVFHVRRIRPTDVDGAVGVNHFFLIIETKDTDVAVSHAQRRFIEDMIDLGVFTAIYVWGKREPTAWQYHCWDYKSDVFTKPHGEGTMLGDMEAFAHGWIDKNDSRPNNYWRLRMINAALKGATQSEKRELIETLKAAA
jgi:hypothetical protein